MGLTVADAVARDAASVTRLVEAAFIREYLYRAKRLEAKKLFPDAVVDAVWPPRDDDGSSPNHYEGE